MVWWRIGIWVVVVAAALFFLYSVRSILLPFVAALVVSVLLDPTIRRLRMRGMSRGAAVSVVFIGFFGILGVLIVYLTPIVGAQLTNFRDTLEGFSRSLARQDPADSAFLRWNPVVRAEDRSPSSQIDRVLADLEPTLRTVGLPTTRRGLVEKYLEPHRKNVAGIVQGFFNSFLGILSSVASQVLFLLLTPLLVIMILADLESMKLRMATWIPPSIRAETLALIRDIGEVFVKYLRGVTVAVGLYTTLMVVLLVVLGTPYSALLGLLAGALYLIPYVGALISVLTLFVVTGLSGVEGNWFMGLGSPWAFAAVATGIFWAASIIYDQFVYPRLVGQSVGLHPLVSMFVIFSGGALFGLVGMILAFPIAGAAKVILERLIRLTSTAHVEGFGLSPTPLRHRTASEV